jgi:hypothetical protein
MVARRRELVLARNSLIDGWNCEIEGRALARLRFGPDAAAITLDHLLADGQPNAGALYFLAVEPLIYAKNAVNVPHFETDSVIFHREQPVPAAPLGPDANVRR